MRAAWVLTGSIAMGLSVAVAAAVTAMVALGSPATKEVCVAQIPEFPGDGPGYELVDVVGRKVWATRDWNPEDFEAFSFPVLMPLWQKNSVRVLSADQGSFLRSPGCAEGEFTFLSAFDRQFLQVVRLVDFRDIVDSAGAILRVELEKYHTVEFFAGRDVTVLLNPEGDWFIEVSQDNARGSTAPRLPEGWHIETVRLQNDLEVELHGIVSVLRLENGDSFQGPLPKS